MDFRGALVLFSWFYPFILSVSSIGNICVSALVSSSFGSEGFNSLEVILVQCNQLFRIHSKTIWQASDTVKRLCNGILGRQQVGVEGESCTEGWGWGLGLVSISNCFISTLMHADTHTQQLPRLRLLPCSDRKRSLAADWMGLLKITHEYKLHRKSNSTFP